VKPEYQEAIERIDADRKRWMKTELMVDCQIAGGMAETLIDEYFSKGEPAPTFWIAKSRLDRILSGEISWPHVYTTDQSKLFECVPLFISGETPAPAPHLRGTLQKIADEIAALKLHLTTNEEYDAGYIGGRNDAFAIVQEAIDNAE